MDKITPKNCPQHHRKYLILRNVNGIIIHMCLHHSNDLLQKNVHKKDTLLVTITILQPSKNALLQIQSQPL